MRHTLAVLVLLSLALPLRADGVFMLSNPNAELSAETPRQQAAIIRRADGREMLILQPTYYGPPGDFAWIVPVPGLPGPEDVKAGVGEFLSACLATTEPVYRTTIRVPRDRNGVAAAGAAINGIDGVTVYGQFDVGKYHAAILSATAAGGLLAWLHDNHFPVPDRFAAGLQAYVNRGWYFVAFRLRADFGKDRAGSLDLEAVGISFATKDLIYPLTLTGLASAPKLSLLLVVADDQPVTCTTFPTISPDTPVNLPRGSCYGTYRRQVLEAHPDGVLLREAVWLAMENYERTEGETDSLSLSDWQMPLRELVLHPGDYPSWAVGTRDWSGAQLSRFFTVLPREHLQDLVFVPDPSAPKYLTLVERTSHPPVPWWAWLNFRAPLNSSAFLALLVCAGVVLLAFAFRPKTRSTLIGMAISGAVLALLLGAETERSYTSPKVEYAHKLAPRLKDGLEGFTNLYGAYPTTMAQLLTQPQPQGSGQDAAGNPVALPAKPRPFHREAQATRGGPRDEQWDIANSNWESKPVPVDPLTGRADTWIIDPLDPEIISSGGFTLRVSMAK
jgi:hypothetical protein